MSSGPLKNVEDARHSALMPAVISRRTFDWFRTHISHSKAHSRSNERNYCPLATSLLQQLYGLHEVSVIVLGTRGRSWADTHHPLGSAVP